MKIHRSDYSTSNIQIIVNVPVFLIDSIGVKTWKNQLDRHEFYGNNALSILLMRIKRE